MLDEAAPAERRRMSEHLTGCAGCAGEVERLQMTLGLLKQMPEQEPPRRIAFVSDPVFEPSWWQRFWQSGPRLGFCLGGDAGAGDSGARLPGGVRWRRRRRRRRGCRRRRWNSRFRPRWRGGCRRRWHERVKAQLEPAVQQLDARLESYQKSAEARRSADLKDVELAMGYLQRKMNNMVLTAARYGGD